MTDETGSADNLDEYAEFAEDIAALRRNAGGCDPSGPPYLGRVLKAVDRMMADAAVHWKTRRSIPRRMGP